MDASYFSVWLSNRYIYHCPHKCWRTLAPSGLLNKTFVLFSFLKKYIFTHLKGTWQTTLAHLPQSNLNQRWWESGYEEGRTQSREVAFDWWMEKGHQQDVCADLAPADAHVDVYADASYDGVIKCDNRSGWMKTIHVIIWFFFLFLIRLNSCSNTHMLN